MCKSFFFLPRKQDKPVELKPNEPVEDNKEENVSTSDNNSIDNMKKLISNKESSKLNWTQNTLKKEYRKFNLDLAPKVFFFFTFSLYVEIIL